MTPCPALLQHVLSHGDYQRQLHVIYLANDILFKALSQRPEGSGPDAGVPLCLVTSPPPPSVSAKCPLAPLTPACAALLAGRQLDQVACRK